MKCPKCGFEQPDGSDECIKCGIIMSRFITKPTLLISSRLIDLKLDLLQSLLRPVAVIKHFFEFAYVRFFDIASQEVLTQGEHQNVIIRILLRVVFCISSLLAYYLRDYDDVILYSLLIAWAVDYSLAVFAYKKKKQYRQIYLKQKSNGTITYSAVLDKNTNYDVNFSKSEVIHIFIKLYVLKGGAFRTKITKLWKLAIILDTSEDLEIYENENLIDVIKKARQFSKFFNVPISFEDSEDESMLTSEHYYELRRRLRQNKKIAVLSGNLSLQETQQNIKISSEWTPKATTHLIGTLFKKSGFFLFILIVTTIMIPFGNLLDLLFGLNIGRESAFMINLSISGILSVITPDLNWNDGIEWIAGIAILVSSARKICRSKYIAINKDKISFYINDEKTSEINTQNSMEPVFIGKPDKMLIVADNKGVITVTDLRGDDGFRAFMIAVHDAKKKFQTA